MKGGRADELIHRRNKETESLEGALRALDYYVASIWNANVLTEQALTEIGGFLSPKEYKRNKKQLDCLGILVAEMAEAIAMTIDACEELVDKIEGEKG